MNLTSKAGLSGKRPPLALRSHFLMELLNNGDKRLLELVRLLSTVEMGGEELRGLVRKELEKATQSEDFWDEWNNLEFDEVERTPVVLCGCPIPAALEVRIRDFSRLQREAGTAVAQFSSHPVVHFDVSSQQWMRYENWQVEDAKRGAALEELLALVTEGKLALIKQCLNCHGWFLARWRQQTCCSTPCRKKYGSTDANFKKRRREYMKNYRKTGGTIQ